MLSQSDTGKLTAPLRAALLRCNLAEVSRSTGIARSTLHRFKIGESEGSMKMADLLADYLGFELISRGSLLHALGRGVTIEEARSSLAEFESVMSQ